MLPARQESEMKLLLFSDLHNDRDAARDLVKRAGAFDVVVGAGDFANMHVGLPGCVGIFRKLACPLVLVAGNNETTDDLRAECSDLPSAHVLRGTATTILGVPFFGVGGGIPITPFGSWSYDFDERQAAELLAPCPAGGVLVVHSPPKRCVDVSSRGGSIGST